MKSVILGVGSNRSWRGINSLDLLKKACFELKRLLSEIQISSVYQTKPMYYENQDCFFNMAVSGFVDSSITPFLLLDKIHLIEASLGRDRSREIRNGPRSIDIDIEIFDNQIINTPDLQIPHPRLKERGFVLVPALEILSKSADYYNRELFSSYLSNLDVSDIEKILDSKDFIKSMKEGN